MLYVIPYVLRLYICMWSPYEVEDGNANKVHRSQMKSRIELPRKLKPLILCFVYHLLTF